MRGNLGNQVAASVYKGSIPACAGEPAADGAGPVDLWVYPRVCGGTRQIPGQRVQHEGLSPRVRGNLEIAGIELPVAGSIPACAGEPCSGRRRRREDRVYPRVCGGTIVQHLAGDAGVGLSPRVRGNLRQGTGTYYREGSIPACAGEPRQRPSSPAAPWVYPRVCGGTDPFDALCPAHEGLSPRVRGNRDGDRPVLAGAGSIPACAGEPKLTGAPFCWLGVYPRVCGGTAGVGAADTAATGLSPRVRGNRRVVGVLGGIRGSIPHVSPKRCQGLSLAGKPS